MRGYGTAALGAQSGRSDLNQDFQDFYACAAD
jgi:hypothetical protein